MTDRQYNSKLLGDKLSQLPVPPNEALWSRIEAQLLVVQHPPAKPLPQPKGVMKAILAKTTIAIVATILLVVFVVWLANKKSHPQQHTPAIRETKQHPIADSTKATTPIVPPVKPTPEEESLIKHGLQPAPSDTADVPASLLPSRKTVDVSLRDSVPAVTPPAVAPFQADSVKLPPKKNDEGYYFETKKKKN